jgi:hypothetical protein
MIFELRNTDDIMKIVATGGGVKMDGTQRSTEDLMKIASAASYRGARVIFTGMALRPTDDLMKIGASGKDNVSFED